VVLGRVEAHVFDPRGDSSLHREFRKAGRAFSAVDESGSIVKVLPSGDRIPSKVARRSTRRRRRERR
jgi:hypothetical protein